MRITARSPASDTSTVPRLPAADRLAESILQRIVEGDIRTGHILPKSAFLVTDGGHSASTVSRALRKLSARNVIHKRGSRWVVGPATTAGPARRISRMLHPYTVLIIMDRLNAWRELCTSYPSLRFCSPFISEAEKRDILLDQVITEPTPYGERVHTSGMMAIVDRIRRMEDTFLGALIVGTRAQIPELGHWIDTFSRLRKPLVWFDQHNDGLAGISLPRNASFTRCYFDEAAVTRASVETLESIGHRMVGLPMPCADFRLASIHERLSRAPNTSIVSHEYPGDFWKRLFGTGHVFKEVKRLAKRGLPHVRTVLAPYMRMEPAAATTAIEQFGKHTRGYIVSLSPVMAPYVKEPLLTALIAPDNEWAKRYYYWLKAAGIRIPSDLSLLSFGNNLESQALPISTIDFGFDSLGYSAIHAILGDIPLSCDQHGSIAARPRAINRGSLARPRTWAIEACLDGELW